MNFTKEDRKQLDRIDKNLLNLVGVRYDVDKLLKAQDGQLDLVMRRLASSEESRNNLVSMINHELHELLAQKGKENGLKKRVLKRRR